MAENTGDKPGHFAADIPQSAIDEALSSVKRTDAPEDGEEIPFEGDEGATSEARKLRAMLEDSAQRAAQTQERLKESHERYLRVAADFENWKKRAVREREETVKNANERLLKDVIPVADNLERALATPGDSDALREGVKLVLKQFTDILGRFGVKSFTSVGQPFDPSRHEALMQQETTEVPPNHVVSEMVKGYMLHDRLVRPAAVVVAKAPDEAGADTQH
jgi:molecular chaperone GrpE